jgi:RNA polymerase sigma factor (sigma-70 family)
MSDSNEKHGADDRRTASDETLVADARSGDQGAFAELWRRHYRSGARVARHFTSSIDADDLVSEAYTRIYQRVLAGGGPSGAFRPYLYTTIRNLASTWGAASRDVQVDDIQDFEDPATLDDPAAIALDRTLTARAFRSLPERWQSVLWYTEVEGMDPHEVAPILGMSANGVAALSYRAREGLRKAWLQAHVSEAGVSDACRWTISRLGDNARHSLTPRENERIQEHLKTCAKCSIISEEVDEVGSHLAMVLFPLVLGGVVGGALLAALGHAGGTVAASVALPAVPASFAVLSASSAIAPTVAAGLSMGAATGVSALVGSLVVAVTLGGSVAVGLAPPAHYDTPGTRTVAAAPLRSDGGAPARGQETPVPAVGIVPKTAKDATPKAESGTVGNLVSGVGSTVNGVTSGLGGVVKDVGSTVVAPVVGDVASGVAGVVTPGDPPAGHTAPGGAPVTADVSVALAGKGMPGATVSVQAGGLVYGTAKVKSDGTWSLLVTALPAGTDTLQVRQILLSLLGIDLISIPITLNTGPLGIVVQLLN